MRKLMRSLGVAVLLTAMGLGFGALPAAADAVADHRAFVLAGFSGTTDEEYRAWAEQVLATAPAGTVTHQAATAALAGTDEELTAFVDGGYLPAFQIDERRRLARLINTATKPNVDRAVQAAVDSDDPAVWSEFLTNGLPVAQYADDELAAARILAAITPESSPVLWDATQVALEASPAELREFIVRGQFVARDLDAANAVPAPAAPGAADAVAHHRAFVLAGFHGTTDEEYRAWAEQVLATAPAGTVTHQAATAALAGTDEELTAFVDGGYLPAFHLDERYRLLGVIATATTPFIDRAAQAAAESNDPAVWSEFLTNGLARAQFADDRLAAARILDVITPESSPVLWQATQVALAASAAELREFIVRGQFVARDLDAQAVQPPVVPAAPPAPAPAAPAPAAPAPAAPAPAAPAAPAARGAQRPVVLATTGVTGGPVVALAASALLAGAGLVVLARRRRQAA
ncbi:hypothetical protein [Cellulomonas wangleii]|uniref:hypothetical protein n=1 Tax=Cellulomonas wangleii TaxID=2816956 RepID=UPI001FB363E0|nr:hypothetical protein [Cellulomonas wangleii]